MSENIKARKLIYTTQGQRWLAQFEVLDKAVAIALANSLTLVSHTEFERNLLALLESVSSEVSGTIGLYAVRELKKYKTAFGYDGGLIPFFFSSG